MNCYYNEHDKFLARWLRNLIANGLICPGDVDDRSILDVRPSDLAGYTQCHFFAGLGLWSLALRWAGWPDDRPIWTGSCPCQPFSQAGRGDGFADDRHLWPAWEWLIRQCKPVALAGEQVASTDGTAWLDVVCASLEAHGYAVGAVDLPVSSLGGPNRRQRLWWVARADGGRREQQRIEEPADQQSAPRLEPDGRIAAGRLADTASAVGAGSERDGDARGRSGSSDGGGLGNTEGRGRGEHGLLGEATGERQDTGQPAFADEAVDGLGDAGRTGLPHAEPSDVRGTGRRSEGRAVAEPSRPSDPWSELVWIPCRDGRWRPTQSGIFPLAPRHPGDVARLRAYGNAISPAVAAEVIAAWLECEDR